MKWSVYVCDVGDWEIFPDVDFLGWRLGVYPELNGAVGSVSENDGGDVEVVVKQSLVAEDDRELVEVLELVVAQRVEEGFLVVLCSCPRTPACRIRRYVASVASSPLD